MHRYYLTKRPPSLGTFPRPEDNKLLATQCFPQGKKYIENGGFSAWGYVEYEKPLTDKQKNDYELLGPFIVNS